MVTGVVAVGFVLAFVLGLLAMKPLDAYLQARESRGSLSPSRRELLKADPRVQCCRCFKRVRPGTDATFDFAKGWECKSHRKPAPMTLRVAA